MDVYQSAIRGCQEELGVTVGRKDVQFLAFGVDVSYHQWSFLDLVDLPYTAAEVMSFHQLHAKDRWEGKIEATPAKPGRVFQRLQDDRVWDIGVVAAYLAF